MGSMMYGGIAGTETLLHWEASETPRMIEPPVPAYKRTLRSPIGGSSKERTKAGLRAARARGRTGGRQYKLTKKQIEIARQLYAGKNTSE
jgi:hypothetical protein